MLAEDSGINQNIVFQQIGLERSVRIVGNRSCLNVLAARIMFPYGTFKCFV